MENKVSQIPEFKRYYLSEFELYDGEEFITFNTEKYVAISKDNENTFSIQYPSSSYLC